MVEVEPSVDACLADASMQKDHVSALPTKLDTIRLRACYILTTLHSLSFPVVKSIVVALIITRNQQLLCAAAMQEGVE